MSRAGVPRAVFALAALVAVSLVSCKKTVAPVTSLIDAMAPDRDTVQVVFKCATVDSVGLFDTSGKPAWNVMRHPNQTITWVVAQTVTINSLTGKSAPLPITV